MEVRNPASTRPVSAAQANRVACRPCQLRLANHPPHSWERAAYLGTPEGAAVAL